MKEMKQANTYKNIYFFNPSEKVIEPVKNNNIKKDIELNKVDEYADFDNYQNSNIISMSEVFEKENKFQTFLKKLDWYKKSSKSLGRL